ncbi:MAG: hypothetical protein GXP48_04070 [Acidobacteria bacterium]|nr:hypothetical protein [Acidobacteriota bacterium]
MRSLDTHRGTGTGTRRRGSWRQTAVSAAMVLAAVLAAAPPAAAAIPAAERQALVDLYNSTNGAAWTNSTGWLGAAGTESSLYGVTCDGGETTVTGLNLFNNNLVGTIPATLGNLTQPTFLGLGYNRIFPNLTMAGGLELTAQTLTPDVSGLSCRTG